MTDSGGRGASSGRGYAYGGPAFVGGIVVGIGLGILLGDFFAWLLIGIGAGFILLAFIAALGNSRRGPLFTPAPLGDAVETFVRREDAERFIADARRRRRRPCELPSDRGARATGRRAELATGTDHIA